MSDRRASSRPGDSYTDDTYYRPIEADLERKHGLPDGLLGRIRKQGERSNRNQVSSAGARSVYQIIPGTRDAFLKKYGVNAYAGDRQAAEVAALHLKESLDRNDRNVAIAIREYHGGPNRAGWGKVNDAYVQRVLGRPAGPRPAGVVNVRGTQAVAPGTKLTSADFLGVAPADVGGRRPLTPRAPTAADVAPKPTGAGVIMQGRVGVDLTPGSTEADASDARAVNAQAVQAEKDRVETQGSWFDRVGAAIDKNWISSMVVRGIQSRTDRAEGDPEWHKEYLRNINNYEGFAQDQDELDMLRSSRAQNSKADYEAVKADILVRRERNARVNSTGYGWAYDLGTSFLDPAGWVATAGVGKVLQLGRVGVNAARAGETVAQSIRPGLLATASEGAITNVAITGALDYSGESVSTSDYLMAGVVGAGIGAALHGIMGLGGKPDTSANDVVDRAIANSTAEVQAIRDEALARIGPNAPDAEVEVAMKQVVIDRAEQALRMSLGERPDADRFLPADAANFRTGTPTAQARAVQQGGLEGFADPAERGLAAEISVRSREIRDTAKASGLLDKGLEGRFLRMVGEGSQESTALQMLRSDSPTLQAVAIQLLESTTGAGGRKPSAAIGMVMRERSYMRHMIEMDQQFDLWRRAEGISKVNAHISPDARSRFDKAIFREVEARGGDAYVPSSNNAVVKAADAWERGMDQMRKEMQRVGTLGHERLGASSRGYMRHMIDPRKLMALTPAQTRNVEAIMARQFQRLNDYTFTNKAGEKITKNFDAKFSRALAKRYLDEAKSRGKGSLFVPANLHTSESAEIVRDALKEIQGLSAKEQEAILGRFSRGGPSFTKGRLNLDLAEEIGDGMLLGDLFNQDLLSLYRSYARRTAGEVSLAQYGILGKQGLGLLRRVAEAEGATVPQLKAFDQVAAEFLGTPFGKYDQIGWAKNLRSITSATRLGGMGFTQFGELGNALPVVGVKAVMSNIAGMGRLRREVGMFRKGQAAKNPILDDLDEIYGFIGGDDYNMTRLFDAPDNSIQLYDQESLTVFDKAVRAGSHFTSVASGFRMIHAVQVRGMSEAIVKKAVRYIHLDKASKALDDMGITPEIRQHLKSRMDKIAEFDSRGNLRKLDLFSDPELDPRIVQEFAQTVERGAGQIIQKTFIGETGAWAHNEFLKLLFQFRTFGITSIEKQWGRNRANYGALRSFAVLIGSMSFALPIHLARVHAQSAGMSRSKRDEFIDQRTNTAALVRATMQYTSIAGLAPDAFDVVSTFGSKVGVLPEWFAEDAGVRGRQPGLQGLVPSVGVANDAIAASMGADFSKLPRLLPGSNLPFVTPVLNGLEQD